ncbi:hypothetical protein TNCV_1442141 [Trichonephila clavipes]|uniref:Uncharacterized protein n=1 Tax=Trichonephila clavipes TaxID=2585209 RepID=A0A8X6RU54_TRICX|nr:hypothetical protein TNCV_1442141 [Trichonephila clavipes]
MTRRVENRERSRGYARFVKPVFTNDSKPLGKKENITREPRDREASTPGSLLYDNGIPSARAVYEPSSKTKWYRVPDSLQIHIHRESSPLISKYHCRVPPNSGQGACYPHPAKQTLLYTEESGTKLTGLLEYSPLF